MFIPHFTAFPTAFQFLPANAMLANKFCEQRAYWSAISQKTSVFQLCFLLSYNATIYNFFKTIYFNYKLMSIPGSTRIINIK